MTGAPENAELARLLQALEPYLDEVIFVGGWAHRLHELARGPGYLPLMTEDADVAIPTTMKTRGEPLDERLHAVGFEPVLIRSDLTPPVAEYRLRESGFKVEFLAEHHGAEYGRHGKRNVTVAVAGVTAQRLRHLDLLLLEPWRVRLADDNGFPVGPEGMVVRVAHPAMYVIQKLVVLGLRDAAGRAKDLLYIHDTVELFGAALGELRAAWLHLEPRLPRRTSASLKAGRALAVGAVTDLHREAARIAAATSRPSPPTAELVRRRCEAGVALLLGRE